MALTKEDIIQAIASMSVKDVCDLVEAMEKEFGVTAQAIMPAAAAPQAANAAAAEEQTEFTVVMTKFGDNKVNVIKVVRVITGLGLKEAKDLVEGAPATVKDGISKDEAAKIKKDLEEAGASVEIK